jgi:hypothetical protein
MDSLETAAIAAVERYGGYRPASRATGISESTLRDRVKRAKEGFVPPPHKITSYGQILEGIRSLVKAKPRMSIRADVEKPVIERSEYIRCLDIGDTHDHPKRNKDRFYWMGCLAREQKVDYINHIGDFADFDSLNSHVKNETYNGRFKPTFEQDLASLRLALAEFERGLEGYDCPKHITFGNHEHRAWRFEDNNPEIYGMMQHAITSIFEEFGWTWTKYGEWHFISGVGYTHCPFNSMGKPYGGKTQHSRVAADTNHDVVMGHSHQQQQFRAAKLNHEDVTIINLGCALPQGEYEDYAELSNGGWWWGVA